jgi:hypothetical protein
MSDNNKLFVALPGFPTKGKIRLSGPLVMQHFGVKALWLYSPPFYNLRTLATMEEWEPSRVDDLPVDYDQCYLIADCGIGSDEGVLLDCTDREPSIRALRLRNAEDYRLECPVVFVSAAEFHECVVSRASAKSLRV